ncbi:MAG: glycerophosphodiester phosphodiesterase family protein [Saonia sp.]
MYRIVSIALMVLSMTFLSCENMNEPLVIGHRGAMGHETENTLASVQKALDLGVDMIEIDVFKIESGEIVVFHDERVERLSNGGGKIEEYNIFDLNQLILDGNHKIPMLQDVLDLIDNKVRLNIELKGANTAERVHFITDYYIKEKGWTLDNFLISSFNWEELEKMRAFNTTIPIAVLIEGKDLTEALSMAKELQAEAINPYIETLNLENANEIRDAGFKIYTWTVNEIADINKAKRIGVDGIITNYPERIN